MKIAGKKFTKAHMKGFIKATIMRIKELEERSEIQDALIVGVMKESGMSMERAIEIAEEAKENAALARKLDNATEVDIKDLPEWLRESIQVVQAELEKESASEH